MLDKFLKEVFALTAGKQAENLVDILAGKKYINEFIIAKKLDLTINQTRNILYKISDSGLVSFIRKKDKRKGWYTYFWKIEIMKCLEFLRADIIKKIDQIHHQIKSRETKEYYSCNTCTIEFNEENALIHDFACNECGGILSRKDNSPIIKEYNKNLDRLEKEVEMIDEELAKEREKAEKIKAKELKKAEKNKPKKKATKKIKKAQKSPKKKAKTKPAKKAGNMKKKTAKKIKKAKKSPKKKIQKKKRK